MKTIEISKNNGMLSKYNTTNEKTRITNLDFRDDGVSVEVEWGGFFLPNKRFEGKKEMLPKVGDEITIYSYQGSAIRGIDINGVNLFYLSDQNIDDEHEEWKRNYEREKQETFEKEKVQYDEQYESLPQLFKDRIDKFRKDNPKFRVDYEAYELFTCTEAVKIAETLKTGEKIREFSECNDRWSMVPDLDHGHSGNTMGMATRLAFLYVEHPDFITEAAGALAPLVGSREYEEKNKRKTLKK